LIRAERGISRTSSALFAVHSTSNLAACARWVRCENFTKNCEKARIHSLGFAAELCFDGGKSAAQAGTAIAVQFPQ
jgi:hypothetical protein